MLTGRWFRISTVARGYGDMQCVAEHSQARLYRATQFGFALGNQRLTWVNDKQNISKLLDYTFEFRLVDLTPLPRP